MSRQRSLQHEDKIIRVAYKQNVKKQRTNIEFVAKNTGVSHDFIMEACSTFKIDPLSPLPIVYKDPTEQQLSEWLSTSSGYIQSLFNFDGAPFILEDYQEQWVEDNSKFIWCGKSRRTGLSLAESAKKLSKAMLINVNHNTTIISYTLEEAIGKVDYARALYDSIPSRFKKKKMRDRRQSLEFFDPTSNTTSKILSHAQRAPRGGGGDIVFDEYAHFQWAYKLLEAALACILTGGGDISMISTPFGDGCAFHEVGTNLQKYHNYNRHYVYWWDCRWLCTNVVEARRVAPKMTTEERVNRFGTTLLRQVFESYVDLESFQQEMEIVFLSSVSKFFSRDLILSCVYPHSSQKYVDKFGNVTKFDPNAFDSEEEAGADISDKWKDEKGDIQSSAYPILNLYANDKKVSFYRCATFAELKYNIQAGMISPLLLAGFDVGRTLHKSVLKVLEEITTSDGCTLQIERFSREFSNTPLHDQEKYLYKLLNDCPMLKIAIDKGGLGRQIADRLKTLFPSRVKSIDFSATWKGEVTKSLKTRFEKEAIAIAEDRTTIEHIHSIKRYVGLSMVELFAANTTKKDKHHGDHYWALAMAADLGTPISDIKTKSNISSLDRFQGARIFAVKQNINTLMNTLLGGRRVVSANRPQGFNPNNIVGMSDLPMPDNIMSLPSPKLVI